MKNSLIVLFAALLWGCGSSGTEKGGPRPITDPSIRVALPGYSVLPPTGPDWYVLTDPASSAVIFPKSMRARRPETNTVHALVAVDDLGDRTFTTPADFAEWSRLDSEKIEPARLRLLRNEVAVEPARGPWCVRLTMVQEDKSVPMFPGKTFVITTRGYRYLHPHWPRYAVSVIYSQRIIEGETGPVLDAEVQQVFDSLTFTSDRPNAPLPRSAATQKPQPGN